MRFLLPLLIILTMVQVFGKSLIGLEGNINSLYEKAAVSSVTNDNLGEVFKNITPELLKNRETYKIKVENQPVVISSEQNGERILIVGNIAEVKNGELIEQSDLASRSIKQKVISSKTYPKIVYEASALQGNISSSFSYDPVWSKSVKLTSFNTLDFSEIKSDSYIVN